MNSNGNLEEESNNTFQNVAVNTISAITYFLSMIASVLAFVKSDYLQILYFGIVSAYCVEVLFFKMYGGKKQTKYAYLKKQWVSFYERCQVEKVHPSMRRPATVFVFLLLIFIRVVAVQIIPFALYLLITGMLYLTM